MRILGLDIGDKRIGVAVSDELEIISTPLEVIRNDEKVDEKIREIINKYNIKKIVVGMPFTLKGLVGAQAKKTVDFVENTVKNMNVEVDYIDERYTTKIPSKLFGKYSKNKMIDKFSASIILGDYLNRRKRKIEKC
ncbi:MAG TPA: Holliday junction resolvase RuvX [Candidatus Hydromicrobium sp.]